MRKLIYAINITIDGCCDHTKVTANEGLLEYYGQLIRDADLLVYGRITYQIMVPYWPDIAKNNSGKTKAEIEFAQVFDSANKVIFSQSLDKVEDKNSRIVHTKIEDEITKLKQQSGKGILLGGVSLPSHLIQLGLVDEYYFVVLPLVVGGGRRLFEGINLVETLHLKFVDSKNFKSGCVALHYLKQ